jgi:medium-chain acyl-[acyl-carrier-protein] hydrolase
MNELDYSYQRQVEVWDLNQDGLLKPSAYQTMFEDIADRHLKRIGLDVDVTTQYGLAWVLVSLSIEVVRPVKGCEVLVGTTWHSQRRGPFYRREFRFCDQAGQEVFHGATYSVLMDLNTRKVFRKREAPFPVDAPIETLLMDASPSCKVDVPFTLSEERKVRHSYIDRLGHVNNCRYGEFAYDALSSAQRDKLSALRRMDIYFLSEMRDEDTFGVEKAQEGATIYVRGQNHSKGDTSFLVKLEFSQED